uniref:Tudor domain-containing protein n=1 Tax=Glossina austeni TaxID=7395 RepID=A0A1A9VYD7_GLOAU
MKIGKENKDIINGLSCSVCREIAHHKCERCLELYCSAECQMADWPKHKWNCYKMPNLIKINAINGRVNGKSNLNDYYLKTDAVSTHNVEVAPAAGSCFKLGTILEDKNFVPLAESLNGKCPNSTFEKIFNGQKTCVAKSEKILKDEDFVVLPKKPENKALNGDFFNGAFERIRNAQDVSMAKGGDESEKVLKGEDFVALTKAPNAFAANDNNGQEAYGATSKEVLKDDDLVLLLEKPESKSLNADCFNGTFERNPNAQEVLKAERSAIRITGERTRDGFYNTDRKKKTLPLTVPREILSKEPDLSLAKCFPNGDHALLYFSSILDKFGEHLDTFLNSTQAISFDYDVIPDEKTFVAALTPLGWRRVRLLGFHEEKNQFLVYVLDEGTMIWSTMIKRIPAPFLTLPMGILAISNFGDFKLNEILFNGMQKLVLKELPKANENDDKLVCGLYYNEHKIGDVKVSMFSGLLSELNLKWWHESIEEGSAVYITHLVSYKQIFIAAVNTLEYEDIFASEIRKCPLFATNEPIIVGDVVFVSNVNAEQNCCYRGEILGSSGDLFEILNVDRGCKQSVNRKVLRKASILVRSLPVRCFLVNLMLLQDTSTPIEDNKAIAGLESCIENATDFDVTYDDVKNVDLLFRTKQRQSLCSKLLPMLFEARLSADKVLSKKTKIISIAADTGHLAENMSSRPSPPYSPDTLRKETEELEIKTNERASISIPKPLVNNNTNKIYTVDDLEVIPIECGDNVELYILTCIAVLNGSPFVTAFDCSKKEFISEMENYWTMVADYCAGSDSPPGGYKPKRMEICLAVYNEDGQWYRALCLGEDSDGDLVRVMYIDYGNVSDVEKYQIKPITKELMFPSNANVVYVEGMRSNAEAIAFVKNIVDYPIVLAKVDKIDGTYIAKLHDLENLRMLPSNEN